MKTCEDVVDHLVGNGSIPREHRDVAVQDLNREMLRRTRSTIRAIAYRTGQALAMRRLLEGEASPSKSGEN